MFNRLFSQQALEKQRKKVEITNYRKKDSHGKLIHPNNLKKKVPYKKNDLTIKNEKARDLVERLIQDSISRQIKYNEILTHEESNRTSIEVESMRINFEKFLNDFYLSMINVFIDKEREMNYDDFLALMSYMHFCNFSKDEIYADSQENSNISKRKKYDQELRQLENAWKIVSSNNSTVTVNSYHVFLFLAILEGVYFGEEDSDIVDKVEDSRNKIETSKDSVKVGGASKSKLAESLREASRIKKPLAMLVQTLLPGQDMSRYLYSKEIADKIRTCFFYFISIRSNYNLEKRKGRDQAKFYAYVPPQLEFTNMIKLSKKSQESIDGYYARCKEIVKEYYSLDENVSIDTMSKQDIFNHLAKIKEEFIT